MHDPFLVDDALSETTLEIARCWADYDRLRPFDPWARGVARRVALSVLRKYRKNIIVLDEESLDLILFEVSQIGDEGELEQRKQTLSACLAKLPKAQSDLVRMRYFENLAYEQIATILRKSISALYVMLHRTHQTLSKCVRSESKAK